VFIVKAEFLLNRFVAVQVSDTTKA